MAKTIPQLTEATTVSGSDELIVQQSNVTKRVAASLLMNNAPVLAEGSTTSRSLETRFAEMTNVKDFGAVGDGTTDDTAAIVAAIASLPNGGRVFFPQGHYRITSTITITGRGILLEGDGAADDYSRGTSIIVNTPNTSGLIFRDGRNHGLSRITVQGPQGAVRLTAGSLVEAGGGVFGFSVEDCNFQRGYNGITLFGSDSSALDRSGYLFRMRGCRVRIISGDYCIGCVTKDGTDFSWQGLTMDSSDTSAGDHIEYRRPTGRTFSLGMFVNSTSQLEVTLVATTTGAKTILTEGQDYTVSIGDQSATVTIDAGVSLTNVQRIIFRKIGGLRGIGTTLCYFDGRTSSHKIINCSGGFGGDGYWFRNTTQKGRPGGIYIANGGLENITGSAIRLETGNDYKIANCYFGAEGYGLDVINDPAGAQNITGVSESPLTPEAIRLTVPNHGFDGTADLIVSGVQGTDISDANGRFPAADSENNVPAGYAVTGVNTIDLNYRLVGGNADAVQWLPTSAWSSSPPTGNARTRVAGTSDASVVNTLFRSARKSGIRVDSGYVKIVNCKVTTSGSGDKPLFGINVSSLANSGDANKMLVTTQYPHGLEVGNLVRFEGLNHPNVSVSGITRSGTTATVTAAAHGYATGDRVTISGATGVDANLYNRTSSITVVDASTFTYTMSGTPTGSATGTIVAELDLSYVYGSVETVVTDTQVKLSATGMNSAGSMVSMEFAGPYDAGTVLLIPSGANVELGPNANDVSIIGNQLGDINDAADITPYGIWNKSGKTIQILDNNCTGVRRRGIRNDVVSPSTGFSQIWRGNITDTKGGLTAFSELIGTGTPESVVTAPVGSLFRDLATGEMYRKNSGAGNTGWLKFTSA